MLREVRQMSQEAMHDQIISLVEPFLEEQGLELVHLDYRPGRKGHLCLYIDKPGGVTLDDCERASRGVSDLLDAYDPLVNSYVLEVSSPGVERPLSKEKDFERFKGQKAKINTEEPIEGRKRFSGTLGGLQDGLLVMLLEDGSQVHIPLANIHKAHLCYLS
jgi:ribosome maturation factor RimP